MRLQRPGMQTLWRHAHLVTLAGSGYSEIVHGALLTQDDRIAWVGAENALPPDLQVDAEHDLDGALVTPGLIDCHTHLVYGGDRAREFEERLQGASYEEIARAGGGIRSTVAATRAASDASLFDGALHRARTLMAGGVTTLEIKSGYGLSLEHEARCLRVARRLGVELPVTVRRRAWRPMPSRPSSTDAPTTTSTPSAAGCRRCTPRAWSMPSMPSASTSPSRRRRRRASSRPRGRWACRSSCMPSS